MMINEYETVSGKRIVRGNERTRRKPASAPLLSPQISDKTNLGGNPDPLARKPGACVSNISGEVTIRDHQITDIN
jgi:hypothetical protein